MNRAGFVLLNAGVGALVLFSALMAVVTVDALSAGDLAAGPAWLIAALVVVVGAVLQLRFVRLFLPLSARGGVRP